MGGSSEYSSKGGNRMYEINRRQWLAAALGSVAAGLNYATAADATKWLQATAYAVPKELTNQGSGYFAIVDGKNGKLYIGTAKYGVNCLPGRVRSQDQADEGRRRLPQGDRHRPQGLRRPVQDPHPQQRRPQRQDLLRHQAGLSGKGRKAHRLPGRLPDGLRPGDRQDAASTRSRSRITASSASRPTRRATSPTSPPAPTRGRSRAVTS